MSRLLVYRNGTIEIGMDGKVSVNLRPVPDLKFSASRRGTEKYEYVILNGTEKSITTVIAYVRGPDVLGVETILQKFYRDQPWGAGRMQAV